MTVSTPQRQTEREPQKIAGSPRRSWWKAALPFLAWQVIALFVVELALFFCGLGEEEIFKLDREIGFTHMPNKRVTWRSEGFSQSYFNADGMREPGLTIAKSPGTFRIALLGDSMVESLQVPLEQTFGQLLQKQLSEESGRPVQVINFGNSGYSTAQDYLQLKRKVFKYSPDAVVLGYSSRDMFENWSPPDQTITNVRPFALHLPGGKLVVENASVLKWMKTPRAKYLAQIEWLRQHSRIYGLISATETQLSFRNPLYRLMVAFLTNPKKASKDFADYQRAMAQMRSSAPPFRFKTFMDRLAGRPMTRRGAHAQAAAAAAAAAGAAPVNRALVDSSIASAPQAIPGQKFVFEEVTATNRDRKEVKAAPQAVMPAPAAAAAIGSEATKAKQNYVELMSRTMGSLLDEMKKECAAHGATFTLVTLPCRAALCPGENLEAAFFNITYQDEIAILKNLCRDEHIDLIDAEEAASKLEPKAQTDLFYTVHLKPAGHLLMVKELAPRLSEQVKSR